MSAISTVWYLQKMEEHKMNLAVTMNKPQRKTGLRNAARILFNKVTPTRGSANVSHYLAALCQKESLRIQVNEALFVLQAEGTIIPNSVTLAKRLLNAGILAFDIPSGSTPKEIKDLFNALTDKSIKGMAFKLAEREYRLQGCNDKTIYLPIRWRNLYASLLKETNSSHRYGLIDAITNDFGDHITDHSFYFYFFLASGFTYAAFFMPEIEGSRGPNPIFGIDDKIGVGIFTGTIVGAISTLILAGLVNACRNFISASTSSPNLEFDKLELVLQRFFREDDQVNVLSQISSRLKYHSQSQDKMQAWVRSKYPDLYRHIWK